MELISFTRMNYLLDIRMAFMDHKMNSMQVYLAWILLVTLIPMHSNRLNLLIVRWIKYLIGKNDLRNCKFFQNELSRYWIWEQHSRQKSICINKTSMTMLMEDKVIPTILPRIIDNIPTVNSIKIPIQFTTQFRWMAKVLSWVEIVCRYRIWMS